MMCCRSASSRNVMVLIMVLAACMAMAPSSSGQIITGCTTAVINSFTPCFSYLTGSTNGGGSSPTAECCKSVASLLTSSAECGCLILTGNVPLSLPINRTLAISLPRICNSRSIPILQCKGSATPLPPPGPVTFGPSLPPLSADPAPSASELPPFLDTPTSSPGPVESADNNPTAEGLKPLLFPSAAPAASSKTTFIQSLLLLVIGTFFVLLSKF